MATRSLKHSLDVYFRSSSDKDAFMARLKRIRERLTPPGKKLLSYQDLMLRMFDAVEASTGEATQATDAASTTMNRNRGNVSLVRVFIILFYNRLVHSFTCAGMLPVQYTKFTQFAGLGVLGTSYILRGMCILCIAFTTMYISQHSV